MPVASNVVSLYETIGRRVFYKKDVGRIERGNCDWRLFYHLGTRCLSTDRVCLVPLDELSTIARRESVDREGTFLGWAMVSVHKASTNGRTVIASATKTNDYHADIALPHCAVSIKSAAVRHAREIAREVTGFLSAALPAECAP